MNEPHPFSFAKCTALLCAILTAGGGSRLCGQAPADLPHLVINADKPGIKISPRLYGLMTEEINHSYQGGIYAELIQNRDFKGMTGPATEHWSMANMPGAEGKMTLDTAPLAGNAGLAASLRVECGAASGTAKVRVSNEGYWGIPVYPHAAYHASIYARAGQDFNGALTLAIESNDGTTTFAQADIPHLEKEWKLYKVTLTTNAAVKPSAANRFVIASAQTGSFSLGMVSLFPPTYKNHPNGNRLGLMERLERLHPAFMRFPGGDYLEGVTFDDHFDWKKTIGKLKDRPGHRGSWGYWSTDGLGLLEFLQWCEDFKMTPVLAVFAGHSLNGAVRLRDGLEPYIADVLDEIEYITGGTKTVWGARRAADGHPAPFHLEFVEIGTGKAGVDAESYNQCFTQFYDTLKNKYPKLQIIAAAPTESRTPDLYDEHIYNTWDRMLADVGHYDDVSRSKPKIIVGEWASHEVPQPWLKPETKGPTPPLKCALADAAWMIGLERNSDLVVMGSYAPALVNVNPGARQWGSNLIGYGAVKNFGSPSYHAISMFAANRGDVALPVSTLIGGKDAEQMVLQGGIGVGSWRTRAEYKDIQVTRADEAVYKSDFSGGPGPWTTVRGTWQVVDGALRQTALDANTAAVTGDAQWGDYTLNLKARKIDGEEGFIIRFHARDDANYVHLNLGGWNNTLHGLEKVRDGNKRLLGERVPGAIEAGRWYDVRVELHGRDIRCYLDGKLILNVRDDVSAAQPVIAAASRDLASGDVILKAVNATGQPQAFRIDLHGVPKVPAGSGQVLTGGMDDVNTLDQPDKITPQRVDLKMEGGGANYQFPARSITVLRFKTS